MYPAAGSELIGRNAAVQRLREFLSLSRAITLTGPGGIGKTALALEVTRGVFTAFHGDCWLVDLAPLSDPSLVPSMVAGVLGLKLGGTKISPEAVARAIGGRSFFSYSTIANTSSTQPPDWRKRSSASVRDASIVATSREVLRIEGEHVYRVPPARCAEPASGGFRQHTCTHAPYSFSSPG